MVGTVTAGAASGKAPLSVARVLQIIKVLSRAEGPMSLAELSRQLATPKTSLIGLLRGLIDMKYVSVSDGAYRLGGSSFELANAVLSARQRLHMDDYVRSGMKALSRQSGETVLYGILTGDEPAAMTYVGLVESRNAIRISVGIGDRSPLHNTAGGRILLASLPDDEVRRYLARVPLEPSTPQTETDPEALFALVMAARREGYASAVDQVIQGITGVAAPIRDSSGDVISTLIIAGPTPQMLADETVLRRLVCDAADDISRNLGFRDEEPSAPPAPVRPATAARTPA